MNRRLLLSALFLAPALLAPALLAGCSDEYGPTGPAFAEGALAESNHQVAVCHLSGNGSYNLLSVGPNALAAHLGHGDVLPLGGNDGTPRRCPP